MLPSQPVQRGGELIIPVRLHDTCPHLFCGALPLVRARVLQECPAFACQNVCASAGEEETDLDLGDLIKKGEVAWLSAEEMMKASEAAQSGACCPPPLPHTVTLRAELSRQAA